MTLKFGADYSSVGYMSVNRLNDNLHTSGELRPYEKLVAIEINDTNDGFHFYVKNTHPSGGKPS